MCGSGFLSLNSKLRVLWGSKSGGLEYSSAHKSAEVLGSTHAGTQAFRSHSSCCQPRETKFAGLHLLLSAEQSEPWSLLVQSSRFPWCFTVRDGRSCSRV
jgi:hypothetical protein